MAGHGGLEGARLGRRPRPGWHDRTHRHLDQRPLVYAQVERAARSRRWLTDPAHRARGRNAPGRRPAGHPRCRRQPAHFRSHGRDQYRPRQRRYIGWPQALDHQRRLRGARHLPEGAAGEGPLPSRWVGASRGTLTAQVTLALPLKEDLAPGSSLYTVNMDVANFAAERMVMGQKVEAALLKVSANNLGHWIRGDVKMNGVPSVLDYRKPRDGDADVRVQATLDENARSKFGFDLGGVLTGPVPIKLSGRVAANDGDSRFAVEADLTQSKVDNLLPGWVKPPGRPGRATFTLSKQPPATRIEDLVVEGAGTSVKGTLEVDAAGDVVSANFPVFAVSDGDKATLKAERGADGALRVSVRGDVYDGRGFVKSTLTGPANSKQKTDKDVDLDIKIGTVVGFNGETLRGLDLRLSRRSGVITSLALNAKLGRDAPLTGDLRGRGSNGRQLVFIESNDAGAFFRFTDMNSKVAGGAMWVALDPQSADLAPQEGILNIRDFVVRGEAALVRVAAAPEQAGGGSPGVQFSRLRVEFTRSLG